MFQLLLHLCCELILQLVQYLFPHRLLQQREVLVSFLHLSRELPLQSSDIVGVLVQQLFSLLPRLDLFLVQLSLQGDILASQLRHLLSSLAIQVNHLLHHDALHWYFDPIF